MSHTAVNLRRSVRWLLRIGILLGGVWLVALLFLSILNVLPRGHLPTVSPFPKIEQLGGAPEAIVVLVHGTFNPDASWIQPESALAQTVQYHFGGIRVWFYPFVWSGHNTNIGRYVAGRKLAELLQNLSGSYPTAQIFIVSHSHGGNIALYAVNQITGSIRIAGIVTMGTPFIEISSIQTNDDFALLTTAEIVASAAWFALLLTSAIVGFAGICFAGSFFERSGFTAKFVGVIVFLISLSCSMWFIRPDGVQEEWVPGSQGQLGHYETTTKWVLTEEAKQLRRDWADTLSNEVKLYGQQEQSKLAARLTAWEPNTAPVLCMSTRADEAQIALGKVEPLLEVPADLLANPNLARSIVGFLFAFCLVSGLAVGTWATVGIIRDTSKANEFGFGAAAGALIGGAMISWMTSAFLLVAVTLALVVLAPLSVIARAPASIPSLIAYGSTDVLAEYFTETHTTTAPVARNGDAAPTCDSRLYIFSNPSGLQHSQYYVDPRVLNDLGIWLRGHYKQTTADTQR